MGLFSKNAYDVEKEINSFKFSVPLLVTYTLSNQAANNRQRLNAEATIAKKLSEAKNISERDYLQLLDAYYAEILQQALKALQRKKPEEAKKIQMTLAEFPLKIVENYSLDLIRKIEERVHSFNQALENYQKSALKQVEEGFAEISLKNSKHTSPASSLTILKEKAGFLGWFKRLRKNTKTAIVNKQIVKLNQHKDEIEDSAYVRWTIDLAIEQINQKLIKAKTKTLSYREQDNLVISLNNINLLLNKNPALIEEYHDFSEKLHDSHLKYSSYAKLKTTIADFQSTFTGPSNETQQTDKSFNRLIEKIEVSLKKENLEDFIKLLFEMKIAGIDQSASKSAVEQTKDYQTLLERKLSQVDKNLLDSVASLLMSDKINNLSNAIYFYTDYADFFSYAKFNADDYKIFLNDLSESFRNFFDALCENTPSNLKLNNEYLTMQIMDINSEEKAAEYEKRILFDGNKNVLGQQNKQSLVNCAAYFIDKISENSQKVIHNF